MLPPSMVEKSAAMSPPQPPPKLPELLPAMSTTPRTLASSSSPSPSPSASPIDAAATAAPGGEEDGQPSLKPDAPEEAVRKEDQDPSIQPVDRVSQSSEGPLATSEIAPSVAALSPRAKSSPPPPPSSHPATESTNMIFSDLYKGRKMPLAKLRSHKNSPEPHRTTVPPPEWLEKEHADLNCKDKTKQKEAIKRYMEARVKNDWEFQWPAHGSGQASSNSEKKPIRGRKRPCLRRYSSNEALPHTKAASGQNDFAVDSGADLGGPSRLDNGVPEEQDADNADNDVVDLHLDDDNDNASSSYSDDDDDDDDDAESVYSVVSEDNVNFRPRLEWASELSDDGEDATDAISTVSPGADGILEAAEDTALRSRLSKQARRRRANREEMTWNEGLACFEARRDAWTGARVARVRSKPTPPPSVSPRSARCFFFTRSNSGSTSASTSPSNASASEPSSACQEGSVTTFDAQSIARSEKDSAKHGVKNYGQTSTSAPLDQIPEELLPVETLLPLPYPILPPTNVLRASITPSVYIGLYDKVIINGLQPTCPINLSDMLKACVVGWKRDGEWPPQTKAAEPISVASKKQSQQAKRISMGAVETMSTARRMSFGILGRGGDADESRAGKGIRRSIQKAFGFATSAAGPEM